MLHVVLVVAVVKVEYVVECQVVFAGIVVVVIVVVVDGIN
jgi:hypothetical protein